MMPIGSDTAEERRVSLLSWLLLLGAVITVVWVRVRLLSLPLERDEGEYAYIGQWLLRGIPPYVSGANMKFPGIYLAWAFMLMIGGESLQSIRFAILILDLVVAAGLFVVVRRFATASAARISAAVFLLLFVDSGTLALYGHATRFVAAAVVLALLFMTSKVRLPVRAFLAGASLGLALLAKQHGALFVLFGFWWVVLASEEETMARRIRLALYYASGVFLPVGTVAVWLAASGVLRRAWFWTIEYASAYTRVSGGKAALLSLAYTLRQMATGAIVLWIATLVAAAFLWPRRRSVSNWIFPLLLCSALSVLPGFQFREHYFLTLIPALSIVTGLAVQQASRPLLAATLVFLAAIGAVWNQAGTFFVSTTTEITRVIYPTNPFEEAIPIGAYIRAHTTPGDRIAVLGSEPEIYFYAGRRSATEFIYMYPLLEAQPFALAMQHSMCREIRDAEPRFIVAVNVTASWLGGGGSPKFIFECLNPFIRERYALAGVVDMDKPESLFVWGPESMRYRYGKHYVLVFEHRSR